MTKGQVFVHVYVESVQREELLLGDEGRGLVCVELLQCVAGRSHSIGPHTYNFTQYKNVKSYINIKSSTTASITHRLTQVHSRIYSTFLSILCESYH